MLDDDHERDMMRRQMRAMLLIGAVLMGWMYFFAPTTPPPAPVDDTPVVETATNSSSNNLLQPESRPTSETDGDVVRWPNLPAIPEIDDPIQDEVIIEDDALQLVFTKIGGRLKQAIVKLGGAEDNVFQMIPGEPGALDTEAVYPFGLRFTHSEILDALDFRKFEVRQSDDRSITFVLRIEDALEVTKKFALNGKSHVLNVDVTYTNLETGARILGRDLEPAYTMNWGPGIFSPNNSRLFQPSVLWNPNGASEPDKEYIKDFPELGEPVLSQRVVDVDWIGHRSKYFLAAMRDGNDEGTVDGWYSGTQESVRFGVSVPRFEVGAQGTHSSSFQVYLGPMHLSELTDAWSTLPNSLTFFDYPNFLDWFAKLLLRNMNWWHGFFGNYGVSIILLTLVVRLVMLPLTLKSMRSMKAMQSLQPELAALKEKFGDDQQAFAKAQMDMFKERGVNPLGGCLPMFLQMPIFIALYRMIMNAFEMRGATFLWITDLSEPDHLFALPFLGGVPFIGQYIDHFNLLPILMVVAMVISMRMNSSSATQNPQQQMMMRIMPVFFGVISYAFSAGINLYVLTSTVLGIVQQQVINRSKGPEPALVTGTGTGTGITPTKKKKTKPKSTLEDVRKKRKQHFYTRAQERKRQQVKEAKKQKKKK